MLDARKDPASAKALYDKLVAEGVELDESFLQNLNHILRKYSETVPFEVPTQTSSPSEVRICHPWSRSRHKCSLYLKRHSQLLDRADFDTIFATLKRVNLNPKSKVRVGYI